MHYSFSIIINQTKRSVVLNRNWHKIRQFATCKYLYTTINKVQRPTPDYINTRLEFWNKLKRQNDVELAQKPRAPIKVQLLDGKSIDGLTWQTTPLDIAKTLGQTVADNTVISKVNNELWDLDRALEGDCNLQFFKFNEAEGQEVFWHSTAHVLGEALEHIYGGLLCYGPPIENGFYYDLYHSDGAISSNDFPLIEDEMRRIVKDKQRFERLEVSKNDLLEMFAYNKFKLRVLEEKVTSEKTTVYRCGSLIDLCRGPHIRHTGRIKALKLLKKGTVHWNGSTNAENLERFYGISFPSDKQLKEYEKFQAEAAQRNHRKIGQDQKLFFFHELSPGSCFFQPHGTHIYNTLVDFMKSEYRKRDFHEVITPNIYNAKLWEISGHWKHFSENMFSFETAKDTYALKPMNCPGHCLIFDNGIRSWRELPVRMADFGVLHRNESAAALTGLTRVRRFQQDDAHIFCTVEQIKDEIDGCLDFVSSVYKTFGFAIQLVLSTRPDNFMGDLDVWNAAEKDLENSLNKFGQPWSLNPGDGAFYGPKIDVTITDALNRPHQCGTIQLDFQLPMRFNLTYVTETLDKKRPVIIHRAILGSIERQIAILTENYAGKWPFWLSPRQIMVVPVDPKFTDYAKCVSKQLHDDGYQVEIDATAGLTFNKKIRNAQVEQFNFILVVGDKEKNNCTVNVRTRNNKIHGEIGLTEFVGKLKRLRDDRILDEDSF